MMLRLTVAALSLAGSAAFAPMPRASRVARCFVPSVSYLSEIDDDDDARKRAQEREDELKGIQSKAGKQGVSEDMATFVDFADDFDGGDGQTGVVGDGSNNMEQFDYSEVTQKTDEAHNRNVMMAKDMKLSAQERLERSKLVKDSKSTQILGFGAAGTGYAESLKEKGMENVDRFGEDRLQVRRQQLENWHQQQGLRGAQRQRLDEMDAMESGDGAVNRKRAAGGYFAELSGQKSSMEKSDADDPFAGVMPSGRGTTISTFTKKAVEVPQAGDVVPGPEMWTTEHQVTSGSIKIMVENPTMAFQDFTAAFTADSHPAYRVIPQTGTLERRSKQTPTEITVMYKPEESNTHTATLVIKTKARTWTHKFSSG